MTTSPDRSRVRTPALPRDVRKAPRRAVRGPDPARCAEAQGWGRVAHHCRGPGLGGRLGRDNAQAGELVSEDDGQMDRLAGVPPGHRDEMLRLPGAQTKI